MVSADVGQEFGEGTQLQEGMARNGDVVLSRLVRRQAHVRPGLAGGLVAEGS